MRSLQTLLLSATVALFLVPNPLSAQGEMEDLEARLASATGRERIGLLAELAVGYQKRDPAKAVTFGTEALEILGPREDPRRLAVTVALGSAYLQLGDYEASLRHDLRGGELARAVDDRRALADSLIQAGYAHYRLSDYGGSLAETREALALYEELGEKEKVAQALSQLGSIHWGTGHHSGAIDGFMRALEAYDDLGDRFRSAGMRNNLGVIYKDLGQLDRALELHRQALAFHEAEGNQKQIAGVLNNVARIHESQGDLEEARATLERSLAIQKEIGNQRGLSFAHHHLGVVHQGLGNLDRAIEHYGHALRLREEFGERKLIAGTLAYLAAARRRKGEGAAAVTDLERALAIAEEVGARDEIREISLELSETYAEADRFAEALAAFKRYEAVRSEVFNERNSEIVAEMQARFDSEQKEKEIELLRRQQDLDALELRRQRLLRRTLIAGFILVLLLVSAIGYVRWQRKEVESERKASRRLREIDRLKDDFLANTSHELRTPLYGITGLAESLIDGATGELPEATRANLAMIAASGRRLSHLVGDILDFSKLRHKSLELRRRSLDLRPLVEVVLTLSRPLVGSKDVELSNGVPEDLPPIDADEDRLQQILYNLVGNAIKFTDTGKVEVAAAREAQCVLVRVTDTGIGIPQTEQRRIFEAFEQADASTEREYGGTGLGLAVTRRLVELHGGRIWVESQPKKGSSFFFEFPVAREEALDDTSVGTTVAHPATKLAEAPGFEPVGGTFDTVGSAPATGRVLVVDDEPVNRQVLHNYLTVQGFELTLASSGAEALRILEEQAFDLVLLDVMMPKLSGYEVCRILRSNHSIEELPVIFLTAKTQASDVVTGLSLGANDFLTKPISRDELVARVRPHLELLQVHRNLEEIVEEKVSQIKVLRGLLPICSSCKKIRDDGGDWDPLEVYIHKHSEANFSHGICPECLEGVYAKRPEFAPRA